MHTFLSRDLILKRLHANYRVKFISVNNIMGFFLLRVETNLAIQ